MQLRVGLFAKTFAGPGVDGVLDSVAHHRLSVVQFNLSCAGLDTVPAVIDADTCSDIRRAFCYRGIEMAALSATYNMIDPDRSRRELMTRRAAQLIRVAPLLGTHMVTLCTGSRDRHDMWREQPENNSSDSWRDLTETLCQLIPVAEASEVTLGIEPERGNVVNSAQKARNLLNELRSKRLRIILDGANLCNSSSPVGNHHILQEAFELLGPDVYLIHAKEIPAGADTKLQAVGQGRMNWKTYFDEIKAIQFSGSIIVHNVEPRHVDDSVRFVRESLAARGLFAR